MSSQNHSGNGCRFSLEYCLTNLFALTDLSGIRWRRLRSQPALNMEVVDDPVLSSYARCLNGDILCAWSRVSNNDGSDPPPNFLEYAKELWVFWYGDEPQALHHLLAGELQEFEQGSWETTLLSYECRTFLFKALHNVIERCLLAKGFIRVGKWFVQPHSSSATEASAHYSFSFQNFFLHGESTVCVSVDVDQHPPLYNLSVQHLRESAGTVPVILAPYGLAGKLTGGSVSPADKTLQDWQQFYPVAAAEAASAKADRDMPPSMVEVAVGGVRLKYPACFVLTTARLSKTSSKTCGKVDSTQDKCERCLPSVMQRSASESVLSGRKADHESVGSWPFQEPSTRNPCVCVKTKYQKQKHHKQSNTAGGLTLGSPKHDSKRSRTAPFHRRSPPLDEGQLNKYAIAMDKQSQLGAATAVGGQTGPSLTHTDTPQALTKDLLSPTSFIQPSPVFATALNPSSAGPSSQLSATKQEEEAGNQDMKPPPSVPGPKSVGTPAYTKPSTPLVQQQTDMPLCVSVNVSPQKDLCKRPRLPSAIDESEDELTTNSLYRFNTLSTWLNLPLKRFRTQEPSVDIPKSYTDVSHPLERLSNGESGSVEQTTTYFLSNSLKSEVKGHPSLSPGVVSDNLMTETALKPKISDLDKLFAESEDEDGQQSAAILDGATSQAGGAVGTSGGSSMYSANTLGGTVCTTDLCKIYPTPPSNDVNFALSPVDHLNHLPPPQEPTDTLENSADVTTASALFKNSSIAKYLSSSEYQPIDLPSVQQKPVSMPSECIYRPWPNRLNGMHQAGMLSPLHSVEHLPSTLMNHQPSSVQSTASSPLFYPMIRTPLGLPEALQSPASVLSHAPKSVTGMLSSVEGPATHGAPTTNNCQSLPEGQSLLVNMALTDSLLNLYKDQNFDSCGLCVCNMNILGSDLGLYLPREKSEAQYKCTCGFSAVINRHYGYCSGLFYEDESEITNDRDDRFDKLKLCPLTEACNSNEVEKVLLNRLKEQFGTRFPSLLARSTNYSDTAVSNAERIRVRELHWIGSIISSALDAGQFVTESSSNNQNKLQLVSRWARDVSHTESLSCSEVEHLLKTLQPMLQDAMQKKRTTSLWDHHSFTVAGPMTWQAFFKFAGGRSCTEELLEPQPVPTLLLSVEEEWLRESPFALQHWEKLLLKPYCGEHSVVYIVIAPENDFIVQACKRFFREISQVYEQCNLGRHVSYHAVRDGILRVGPKLATSLRDKPLTDWFQKIDSLPHAAKLKLLARACKHQLAPLLKENMPDVNSAETKPTQPSTFLPPASPAPNHQSDDKENTSESRYKDMAPKFKDGESTTQALVIYMVDPFSGVMTSDHENASMSTLALFMCYQELLENLPEDLKLNTQLQIIPLHNILSNQGSSLNVHMLRNLAFSVFSTVNKKLQYSPIGRALTGFGPIADLSHLSKRNTLAQISLAPFILAPPTDNVTSVDSVNSADVKVLFCSYCLSEDQRWLLASVINDNGELLDTNVINIFVPNRSRRRKASVIKHGIQRLYDYLLSTMSQFACGWRLVVGRVGRLGHGELKIWARVLSRKALIRASKQMRDACPTCTASEKQCSLLSACLTSIEPHASFNILLGSGSLGKEEKKSSSCLLTPADASVTHILVIPNSTTAGGNQSHNEAQLDFTGDMNVDDGLLGEMGELEGLEDLFGIGGIDGFTSPSHSPTGSPTHALMSGLSAGISTRRNTISSVIDGGGEEQVNLLQQPLSTGYLISSAPTGTLPKWFWSAAPKAEHCCPTVLKSALHFHSVSAQQNQEDIGMTHQLRTSGSTSQQHPLDSNTTCDVLRYVLDSYNRLSWLTIDPLTNERRSCLPMHIEALMQLYRAINTYI